MASLFHCFLFLQYDFYFLIFLAYEGLLPKIHFIVVTWFVCARVLRAYISGKLLVPMLQLLCNTSKANSLNANTSMSTGFFIYACLKGPIMVMQQSNIVRSYDCYSKWTSAMDIPENPVGLILWKIQHFALFED